MIVENNLKLTTPQVFKWKDPFDTGAEGWVVIDSLVNGMSAGGLFIHGDASLAEVSDLAKTMSYKNTLLEPILGGAKAGIRFDHRDPRAQSVIRRFLHHHKFLLESCWFTGADLNTSNDFIFDVIERDLQLPSAFYSLAKMLNQRFSIMDQSASLRKRLSSFVGEQFNLETCCTGYSVAMAIKLLTPEIKPRVLIQGYGAVGSSLSYFLNLHQIATIVGIADVDGFIYCPEGISIENLRAGNQGERRLALLESVKSKYHWTPRLKSESDEDFLCRFLSCQAAEIFSPCATRYQITEKVTKTLINKTFCQVKPEDRFIVSGANNAFRFESDRTRLEREGIHVLPEWVSNSGNTILFMESMKELSGKKDWNEHVFAVIRKQLKAFIDSEKIENKDPANNLYNNCTRLATRRLNALIAKDKLKHTPSLLLERLQSHVQNKPTSIAYTLLNSQGEVQESIDYAELDKRARLLAERFYLESQEHQGNLGQKNVLEDQIRIILLYPNSLDFIVAFLACLYAGVVAVPVNAFNKEQFNRYFPLLRSIIKDAGVKCIATSDSMAELIRWELSISEPEIKILCTDMHKNNLSNLHAKNEIGSLIPETPPVALTLSHLQYTSGSLSLPKGVLCTHLNMAHSLFETVQVWQYTAESVTVAWAPFTHVYGLTTGLLVPLYSGSHAVLMSPSDFLVDPLNWLAAISKFKATHSGCPNFGYEFCVEYIDEEEAALKKLNLNHWRIAANGGELVQLETMTKFYNKFKVFGFQETTFYPAYGMSECMGLIATSKRSEKSSVCFVDREALRFNRVVEVEKSKAGNTPDTETRTLVSCGSPIESVTLKIVDPDSQSEAKSGSIGEIWLAGPVCSQGYWNESEFSTSQLSNDSSGTHFIRTGDLGFIRQDELFLVGRLKELIILFGKNYYPIDIEKDVKNSDERFSKRNTVAFSALVESMEELFVLQEIDNNLSEQEYYAASTAIRHALSVGQGIDTYAVILVPPNSIPKTGSGKIQRRQACLKYFNKELDIIFESIKTPVKLRV